MASSLNNPQLATSAAEAFDGSGADSTVSYRNSPSKVIANLGTDSGLLGYAAGDNLAGIENLIGSNHADRLTGDGGVNTLIGGRGNDYLFGGAGNDILYGTSGINVMEGNAGNDIFHSSSSADTFFGGSGTDTVSYADSPDSHREGEDGFRKGVTINLGNTYLDVSGHTFSKATGDHAGVTDSEDRFNDIENIIGTAFADTISGDGNRNVLTGNAGGDVLYGGGGNDELIGGEGQDQMFGGDGDDMLIGGAGGDVLFGGAAVIGSTEEGIDTVSYEFSPDRNNDGLGVTLNLSIRGLNSGYSGVSIGKGEDAEQDRVKEVENIIGSAYGDTLTGDENNNDLKGLAGDDTLEGKLGADVLDGGSGLDTISYASSNALVRVNLAANTFSGGHAQGDSVVRGSFENIIGSEHNDVLTGAAGQHNVIEGGDGADTLDGGGGNSLDTLSYANYLDARYADLEAYKIALKADPDLQIDGVNVDLHLNIFEGGDADGDIVVRGSFENIIGTIHDDRLTGNDLNNILSGGDGDDYFYGYAGVDTLEGGLGINDRYTFGDDYGADIIRKDPDGGVLHFRNAAGIGDFVISRDYDLPYGDVVITHGSNSVRILTASYANGRYTIEVKRDDDTETLGKLYLGTVEDDDLTGTGEADLLLGLAGDDTLRGLAGADTLEGGEGTDILEGGAGADTYVFDGEWGADTIRGDTDGGFLQFFNAAGIGDFRFSRADTNSDAVITTGSNSVTIVADAYGHGRYTLQHGSGSAITTLGKLSIGTDEVDDLTGSDEADLLFGFAGVDTLHGNGGADILYGGKHGDMLYGETGSDTLYGGRGGDRLEGGAGDDTLYGGGGGDTLEGGADDDTLDGGEHDDILDGGAGADTYVFRGDFGADTIRGEEGTGNKIHFRDVENPETLVFARDANNDVIITHDSGSVRILAAAYAHGRYSIHYGDSNTLLGRLSISMLGGERIEAAEDDVQDRMVGARGDDNFEGGGGNDYLDGGRNDDTLRGGAGDDFLYGQQGADRLEGGAGADRLDGGGGDDDTVLYSSAQASSGILGVTVDLSANTGEGSDAQGDTFFGVENIIGSSFADTLTGDEFANELDGGGGADTLDGGAGDDTLAGGTGIDTYVFRSGGGADTIEGDADGGNLYFKDATGAGSFSFARDGDGNVIITVGDDSVKILGDTYGNNLYSMHYGSGDTELGRLFFGTVGDDRRNDQDEVILKGTGGANLIAGFQGDDILEGLAGDDWLYGGDGKDTLEGGAGEDTLDGGRGVDELRGGENDDTLDGGGGGDTLEGGAGDDTLDGGGGGDTLEGGAGADTYVFRGDFGADTIRGETDDGSELHFQDATGVGDFLFVREDGGVRISIGDNSVLIQSYADGRYKAFVGAGESKVGLGDLYLAPGGGDAAFTGSAGADWVVGTEDGNTLHGNEGNDILYGGGGVDKLYGGADNDILYGGKHGDMLYGETGSDTLYGGRGGDRLEGGAGDDTLYGEGGDDTLRGGADDDTLYGGLHDDDLYGGVGDDTYVFAGSYGADTIKGDTDGGTLYFQDATSLTDLIFAKQTNGDLLITHDSDTHGSNSVRIENYADELFGISYGTGSEITTLGKLKFGTDGNNVPLAGTDGGDLLLGLGGDDTLEGGLGDDTLFGGRHHDTLRGGAGSDTLYGGKGNDILIGGADGDTFDGGGGIDTLSYAGYVGSTPADGVTVNLGTNSFSRGDAQGDSLLVPGNSEVPGNIENLIGSAGNDVLTGDAGPNTLTGGDGADRLQGGAGADILRGGKGVDTYVIGAGAKRDYDIISDGAEGALDKIIFEAFGTGYKDFSASFIERSGDNVVNPFLVATYDGDTVVLSMNSLLVNQGNYDEEGNRIILYEEVTNIASLTIENFENRRYEVSVTRSSNDDGISRGAFSAVKETAEGVEAVAFNGGAGRDYILGSVGADIINGLGEDDFIEGGRGKDTIDGGAGADTIYGGRGADIIQGGSGGNFLYGGNGADRIYGGDDIDFIYGNLGNDILYGGADYDRLEGGAGDDSYYGGAGSDDIFDNDDNDGLGDDFAEGGAGDDGIHLGEGIDTASYEHSPASDGSLGVTVDLSVKTGIFVRPEGGDAGGDALSMVENLIGSAFGDTLTGDDGGDHEGVNVLRGLAGDDTLEGGGGNDILEGGAGADTYVFSGNWGADTIRGDTYKGWDLDADLASDVGPVFQFENGVQGDTDGGTLHFKDVTGLAGLSFSRSIQEGGGQTLVISVGDNSVTIEGYADGYDLRHLLRHWQRDEDLGQTVSRH